MNKFVVNSNFRNLLVLFVGKHESSDFFGISCNLTSQTLYIISYLLFSLALFFARKGVLCDYRDRFVEIFQADDFFSPFLLFLFELLTEHTKEYFPLSRTG